MKAFVPFLFFGLACYSSNYVAAQTEKALLIESPCNWTYNLKAGVGLSNEQDEQANWYVPKLAWSAEMTFSRRIYKSLWFSTGAGFDYYAFKSEEFYQTNVGPGYYHTSTGIQPYITVDDQPSVQERLRGYVSIPFLFEYVGSAKWAPYAKVGAVVSFDVYSRSQTVYVNNGYFTTTSAQPIGKNSEIPLLGILGCGVQYKVNEMAINFGLAGNFGITELLNDYDGALPKSIKFEVGLRSDITGKRFRKFIAAEDEKRADRLNYIYTELPKWKHDQFELLYSINYERSFLLQDKQRIIARLGTALEDYQGSYLTPGIKFTRFQFGIGWSYGKVHSFEVSMGVARSRGAYYGPDTAVLPSIGYRFEPQGLFFGRIALSPEFWMNGGVNFPTLITPTVSFGVHF